MYLYLLTIPRRDLLSLHCPTSWPQMSSGPLAPADFIIGCVGQAGASFCFSHCPCRFNRRNMYDPGIGQAGASFFFHRPCCVHRRNNYHTGIGQAGVSFFFPPCPCCIIRRNNYHPGIGLYYYILTGAVLRRFPTTKKSLEESMGKGFS